MEQFRFTTVVAIPLNAWDLAKYIPHLHVLVPVKASQSKYRNRSLLTGSAISKALNKVL